MKATTKRPKESRKVGKDNIAYFKIGQKVLWHNKPGTIESYDVKSYKYPIGYNVHLDGDSPIEAGGLPSVNNSACGEIDALDGQYYQIAIPVPDKPCTITATRIFS